MAAGTIRLFDPERGFGFIRPAVGGGDVFVLPAAASQAGLRESDQGKAVTYRLSSLEGGWHSATGIRVRRPRQAMP